MEPRINGHGRARAVAVAVVDDHPTVSEGLAELLRKRGFRVAGSAGSAAEVERLVCARKPDIAIVDILLGEESGVELVARLRECSPATAVLLYTGCFSWDMVADAVASKAQGIITKLSRVDELVTAICALARGDRYLDPAVEEALGQALGRRRA